MERMFTLRLVLMMRVTSFTKPTRSVPLMRRPARKASSRLVGPFGAHDAIAVVRHQFHRFGARGTVYGNAVEFGFEAEHVIAGDGVAAGRNVVVELVGVLAHDEHVGAHATNFLHFVVEGFGL
jgi:hypothetical protein